MMPEQVWDEPDCPEQKLRLGQPAGSAVPLVWAHAEYLKLLRSAVDGKVFDRIEPVYQRYCEPEGQNRPRRGLEISSRSRPIHKMDPGRTLRILDDREFEVLWTSDGWQSKQTTVSRGLGSAGFSADIAPPDGCAEIEWTLHWPDQDAWLGYNVKVKIDAAP
jgi:glucoamylase